MPNFNIIRESRASKTFRVASVMGKFDIQTNHVKEEFVGDLELPESWQVGLITGASGSGKTTIAKDLFPDAYVTEFEYSRESILDDMPEAKTVEEITSAFNSVGFSSPPSWLKPYHVLSDGQKMRVNLATSLLKDEDLVVFDEFTSVVDRQVARIGSFAIQKAIRRTSKQFIAVTCHSDVSDWLLPDWIFDANDMSFENCVKKKDRQSNLKSSKLKTNRYGELSRSIII